jgi:hypothetical protein
MSRFVEVRYKCACLKEEATVHVPERGRGDDVADWVGETVGQAIGADHRKRSPLCQATKMEYAKIPADGEFIGQGKGGTA